MDKEVLAISPGLHNGGNSGILSGVSAKGADGGISVGLISPGVWIQAFAKVAPPAIKR